MKFLQALSTSLFAALACAPVASAWQCLSDDDAANIIDAQRTFLLRQDKAAGRAAVENLFAPDLLELSDSINALRGVTLGTPVYTNSSAYIEDTLSQNPLQQLNTVEMFHTCNKILWYWEMIGVGGPGKARARGMSITSVDESKQVTGHQIEFNSLTWAENIGYECTAPEGYGK